VAITLAAPSSDVVSLEEYVDYVERRVDLDDIDSVCESAPMFRALLNNRTLIRDFVDRELRRWREYQPGNPYVGQTLVFVDRPGFTIRANMWAPPERVERLSDGAFGTYAIAHDHNFSFMTGGYFGCGYATSIYEYDGLAIEGRKDEEVELRFLEDTTLPQDKIMVYRCAQDVHLQKPAEAFSVSLNLLITGESSRRPQYFFDLERSRIRASSYAEKGEAIALCELAEHVGGERTAGLLADLSSVAHDPFVKKSAQNSLERLIAKS
jgi:hypothetical protein